MLSRKERVQLTWALAWPSMLLQLTHCLIAGLFGLSDKAQLQYLDDAVGILQFFFFTTWVIRRTVRLNFTRFHVMVIREDSEEGTRSMNYRQSLSVAWLICWRSSVVLAFILVLAPLHPQELDLGGWLWTSVAELLTFYIWIVKAALGKRYSGFSLALDRSFGATNANNCSQTKPLLVSLQSN